DEHTHLPAAPAWLFALEIAPVPDRAAAPYHQLKLIHVVGTSGQVISTVRLCPLVAVDDEVDAARAQDLKQPGPPALPKNRGSPQLLAEQAHQVHFKSGHSTLRLGIGIGVRPAPFHVAAVEQLTRLPYAFEGMCARGIIAK